MRAALLGFNFIISYRGRNGGARVGGDLEQNISEPKCKKDVLSSQPPPCSSQPTQCAPPKTKIEMVKQSKLSS
jgi:hypothetical protein